MLEKLRAQGVEAKHPRVILEHITHNFPDKAKAPLAKKVEVLAHASNDGVQAVLVQVDGETRRPDGGLYHITFSLEVDRKPVESNKLIKESLKKGDLTWLKPFNVEVEPF